VISWPRLGSRHYSLFFIAWGQRCLSDANRYFLERRSVSTSCSMYFKSPLSVCSVTASCWWGWWRGLQHQGWPQEGLSRGPW
jgi:hypothetical protein